MKNVWYRGSGWTVKESLQGTAAVLLSCWRHGKKAVNCDESELLEYITNVASHNCSLHVPVTYSSTVEMTHFRICAQQFLSHAAKCGRFCFWRRQYVVFVCVWNILGTAERICAKFTRKTCLVPCSDEFEGQRSRSQGQKMAFSSAL